MKRLFIGIVFVTLLAVLAGCGSSNKIAYLKEIKDVPKMEGMVPVNNKPTSTPTKKPGKKPAKTPSKTNDKGTKTSTKGPTKVPVVTPVPTVNPQKIKSEGIYIVENKKFNDVLKDYEKLLNKDGWKTVTNKKPYSLGLVKNSHELAVSAVLDQGKIKMMVWET